MVPTVPPVSPHTIFNKMIIDSEVRNTDLYLDLFSLFVETQISWPKVALKSSLTKLVLGSIY